MDKKESIDTRMVSGMQNTITQNSIPIIFFHRGNQKYLNVALKQCRKFNEKVILLGDDSNRETAFQNECDWIEAQTYDNGEMWKKFEKNYVSMSTNDYFFELNCFRRFFVIAEMIREKDIDQFVYLDSDIMSYVNFSSLDEMWKADCGMSVPIEQSQYGWVANCGISFWNRKSLTSFLDYCIDIYENHIDVLEEKWNYHRKNHVDGGICDMTLQYLWYKNDQTCKKINLVDRKNGLPGVMDFNVNLPMNCYKNEYKMNDLVHIKKICFENGIPSLCATNGIKVPVFAIHFLGPAKQYMDSYAKKNSLRLGDYIICYLKKLKAFLRKFR